MAAVLMPSFRATPATERHPDLSQIYGMADADGQNWLVSPLEQPDAWTADVLTRGGRGLVRATMPLSSSDPVSRVPAEPFGDRGPRSSSGARLGRRR